MSRLKQLVERLCPDGMEYKTLGELGSFFGGLTGKTKKDFGLGAPFVTYMNVFSNAKVNPGVIDYVDVGANERQNALRRGDALFTISSETPDECGMSSVVTFEPDGPLYLNSFCAGWRPYDPGALLPDYMAYVLRSHELRKQISRTANGVIRFNVSKPLLSEVKVPVPPLEVQREVVRILDSFQELDDALTAEIEAREKQWDYLRERNLRNYAGDVVGNDRDMPMARIGDLYVVTSAKRVLARDQTSSGVPFLKVADFIDMIEGREVVPQSYISEAAYEELESMDMVPEPGDILITARGTVGRFYVVEDGDKFYFQDGMITWLRKTDESPIQSYFDSVFSSQRFMDNLIANCSSGTVKYLSIKGLADCKVPALTAEEQAGFHASYQRLSSCSHYVRQLKAERDARRRQFAHYRDRLLSFPEREA